MLPAGRPRFVAWLTASSADARPCWTAIAGSIFGLLVARHGACRPTYSGTRCHPAACWFCTHDGVRFVWLGHPRPIPPMLIPIARYGDCSHAVIAACDGAAQVSKPRPVYVPGATAAAWARSEEHTSELQSRE